MTHQMMKFPVKDAFLFPTLSENFGHVISEALFAGCPVIISNTTHWTGLESLGAGWDIDLSDKEGFVNAINTVIQYDSLDEKRLRMNAKKYANMMFDLDKMRADYIEAFSNNN